MATSGEWHPMRGSERLTTKGSSVHKESETKWDHGRLVALLVVLAMIAIAICLSVKYPGIVEMAKSVVMAIWDMLCRVIDALSDFVEYVKHQRSS